MSYYSKDEYREKILEAHWMSEYKKQKQEIKKTRNEWKSNKPKVETSKKLAVYLFILLNVVVIYCLVAMWHFGDLTYIGALISDIAAQILIYGIYCLKAYKAKKSEEDMKFKRERLQGVGDLIESGAESTMHVPVNGDLTQFEYIPTNASGMEDYLKGVE